MSRHTRTAPDTRVLAKGQDNRSILSATQSNTWSIVIQAWFVILATLFGIGVLTIDRYDVWRVLLPIAIGWYLLGALLLGYREEHL